MQTFVYRQTNEVLELDIELAKYQNKMDRASSVLVSHGHTPFCKRGKGSGNFRCSRLLHRNLFTPHCTSANAA